MRLAAALLLLAACRSDGGSGELVHVLVQSGDQPAPGVRVYAHSAASGALIGEDDSDAVGDAYVGIEPDTLITADFGGRLLTAPAPAEGETLVLRGPAPPPPALVVGTVNVDGPALLGATYFEVDVGCVTLKVSSLPDSFDVTACSQGQDRDLDVLVRGFHDVGTTKVLDGYFAERVPLINGIATVNVGTWNTTGQEVDGSGGNVAWWFIVGGNPYEGAPLVDGTSFVYAGLGPVESTYIRGEQPGQLSERYKLGVYMPVVQYSVSPPASLVRDDHTFTWDGIAVGAGVVALSIETPDIVWDIALDVRYSVVLPPLADLSAGTATLRYIHTTASRDAYETGVIVPRAANQDVDTGFLAVPL